MPTTASSNNLSETEPLPSTTEELRAAATSNGNPARTFVRLQGFPETRKHRGGQTQPLQLLDLPIDILQEILKEVTHTNDLTSLALTCSALHREATPLIYSRFDIVWPDAHSNADSRQGVDALT
ncbi:MAG: hypothetical protein Q9207_003498 [Kuettlingeria erythrocarpa]